MVESVSLTQLHGVSLHPVRKWPRWAVSRGFRVRPLGVGLQFRLPQVFEQVAVHSSTYSFGCAELSTRQAGACGCPHVQVQACLQTSRFEMIGSVAEPDTFSGRTRFPGRGNCGQL